MDLGVIAMKWYSPFSKESGLESHHQMKFSIIFPTFVKYIVVDIYIYIYIYIYTDYLECD